MFYTRASYGLNRYARTSNRLRWSPLGNTRAFGFIRWVTG